MTSLVLSSSLSLADEGARDPKLRLVVTIDPTLADTCPTSAELASSVIARLGYDPFMPAAPRLAVVDVARGAKDLVAKVRVFDESGEREGERELHAAPANCAELFESVSLTIAIAIDPLSANGPRPPPPASPPRAEPPPPAAPVHEVGRAGMGLVAAIGAAPSPTAGLVIGGEAALLEQRLHVGLDVRADLPASDGGANGKVIASLLVGDVSACYGRTFLGCGVVTAGIVRATSTDVGTSQIAFPFFAAGGGRLGMDLPMARNVAVRPYLDVAFIATRHTLRIDGESRFSFPPLMATAGVVAYFVRTQ